MGESSACLVRSFSAGTSTEAKEGDSLRGLTTSISFGRFTSESLDWEKRSCFSNNRYLEEAEKSSKPGSVAEKKAYFEAHYKRIAAKKAAALLDQQVLASNELDLPESDNVDDSPDRSLVVSEPSKSDSPKTEIVLFVDENVRKPNVEGNESKTEEAEEAKIATKQLVTDENSIQVELSNRNENVEIHSKVALSQQEKMATTLSSHQGNSSSTSKKKLSIRSSNSFTGIRASKLRSSVKLSPVQESKEDSTTQTCKKAASNLVEKKRSTLKSLHMSINFGPRASETSKGQPIIHKMGNSETVRSFAKASRDSSTLQIPTRVLTSIPWFPVMHLASVNRFSVHHSQTHLPLPERRRSKPLDDCSGPGRRVAVGKSQSPSTGSFKPAGASGYKGRPPIVASSFRFRCEERAAKRKEKLEEKLNAGGENMRLQAKSKEKADNFLKLHQSTAFIARPIPNSHRGIESPNNHMKKVYSIHGSVMHF
ncbi:hypothetical protein RHGRI_034236 [Rhododendron griersonianum]|uniref:TPX2 C-terminal domain-containing protein n=1 Tax=Rhododendron griersonianum TaxID=479676 RepID=A0AAV6I5D8_9ERIC|nr:hypothetical protein RHGRI_034236 [Rhododendron griersonianum]